MSFDCSASASPSIQKPSTPNSNTYASNYLPKVQAGPSEDEKMI